MKKTPNLNFQEYNLEGVLNVIFTPEVQHTLFTNIVDNLHKAIKTNKKEVTICNIDQIETSVVISNNNFLQVLESSLEYFVRVEDYSKCSQISKLINSLKNG